MLMVWTAARWVVLVIGIALVLGALFDSSFGIGDSLDPTHLAALVVGIIALGAAIAGKRVVPAYGTSAVLVMNTILLLALVELGAAIVVGRNSPTATLPGEGSPYYRGKPWATAYWREFHAVRNAYHPYFLWRARPFQGRLINVDSNGMRATPGARCTPDAYQVYTFGGSTLWGWGEPDSTTLGALIQSELANTSRRPVCVRNFAQLGSNSTQDLIQLVRELQAGRIPDAVVFYSGVNEITPPYGYGEAGAHFDLRIVASRVEGGLNDSHRARQSLGTWVAGSSLWRLASRIGAAGRRTGQPGRGPAGAGGPFVSPGLADSIVSTFAANLVVLDAVASRYGFLYEVFWQPNALVGRKFLTSEEQVMRTEAGITPLVELVYSRITCVTGLYGHLHDLRDVFAGESALVYLDWHHVNATGNRVIAGAIAQTLSQALRQRTRSSAIAPLRPGECVGSPRIAKETQASGAR
jgi:lysophospholipase L1-like esterase